MLSREDILTINDKKHTDVYVPEWCGTVRVRTLAGHERMAFQRGMPGDGKIPDDMMEQLIVLAACNEAGEPIFTREDAKALSNKSAVALERIFKAAADLNGMTSEAVEAIKGE